MVDVLVIRVPLRSHPIDVTLAFLEKMVRKEFQFKYLKFLKFKIPPNFKFPPSKHTLREFELCIQTHNIFPPLKLT